MEQSKILQNLKNISSKYSFMLIGVDGFGGSGKSTIARSIMSSIPDSRIIEMDDFYSPELERPDYIRVFEQVIKPITLNKSFVYQIYDWKRKSLIDSDKVNLGQTIIIEGVFALEKSIRGYYDYTIWMDCDPIQAMERGIARNLTEDGVDTREKWEKLWYPAELKYVNEQKPEVFANYIVKQNII
ncbi:MAG: hypothetical protein O2871_02805 [bacterium]|nr:hypothetical protein [bacterium]